MSGVIEVGIKSSRRNNEWITVFNFSPPLPVHDRPFLSLRLSLTDARSFFFLSPFFKFFYYLNNSAEKKLGVMFFSAMYAWNFDVYIEREAVGESFYPAECFLFGKCQFGKCQFGVWSLIVSLNGGEWQYEWESESGPASVSGEGVWF